LTTTVVPLLTTTPLEVVVNKVGCVDDGETLPSTVDLSVVAVDGVRRVVTARVAPLDGHWQQLVAQVCRPPG
jgi:hypothetical protein